MQRFFTESVAAARELKLRALLVTNYPEQVPQHLPPGVRTFGYLPFSQILPQAALLVYHGGIGTLAQGIRAGIPQLVVPHGYDQFDSGWRIEQARLGRSIPEAKYRHRRASSVMRELLSDAELAARCQRMALRVDGQSAVARAADLLEALHPSR
jgi:UDP:flavonoid glycosyltransferase YjiC (YdhE family)